MRKSGEQSLEGKADDGDLFAGAPFTHGGLPQMSSVKA